MAVNPFARPVKQGLVCRQCPVWCEATVVCLVRGSHQAPESPACRYGIRLIEEKKEKGGHP